MSEPLELPRLFVSVGTDYHRFDRLMHWLDAWRLASPESPVRLVVQHGSSLSPATADEAFEMLSHDDLVRQMSAADVVVLQGGPGGIIDSLRVGRRPIVVPRLGALKECVDDHQVAFSRHMARHGQVWCAETEPELHSCLQRALSDPLWTQLTSVSTVDASTALHLGALVDELVVRQPSHRHLPSRRGGGVRSRM